MSEYTCSHPDERVITHTVADADAEPRTFGNKVYVCRLSFPILEASLELLHPGVYPNWSHVAQHPHGHQLLGTNLEFFGRDRP